MTDVVAGATPRVETATGITATAAGQEQANKGEAELPARKVVARRRTILAAAAVGLDITAVLTAYMTSRSLKVKSWSITGATLPQGRALLLSVPIWIITVAAYGLYA